MTEVIIFFTLTIGTLSLASGAFAIGRQSRKD